MYSISILRRKQTLGAALRLLSTSPTCSGLSKYGFELPPSLSPNGNANAEDFKSRRKNPKPRYRPPSSLDREGKKPIHSDLPFDFRYSYTESNPNVKPIGLREPKYSPFGPQRIDRIWTGTCAPAVDPTVRSVDGNCAAEEESEEKKRVRRRSRDEILGEPLWPAEEKILIDKCQRNRSKRQVNLGRDGLTHNMLNVIHNHWKHAEVVRIKCLGVPTVDMDNVCMHLEGKPIENSALVLNYFSTLHGVKVHEVSSFQDKTGGKIIQKRGGTIIIYRGRYYNPKKRPVIPLMLWRPHEPVYPKLIKTTIDGLTVEETKDMRKRGLHVPALIKLAKNGYYGNLVTMVRDAFIKDDLVRIDCKGMERSDYKKIGVKLRDLVPCILVTFQDEQIVIWRGDDRVKAASMDASPCPSSSHDGSDAEKSKISDLFEDEP